MTEGVPPWLYKGLIELAAGIAEIPGTGSNARIEAYHGAAGGEAPDDVPWCASFVNWCLDCGLEGVEGTRSKAARSFAGWGWPGLPRLGSVVVLWRDDPRSWKGHVGLYLDGDDLDVILLSGNERNRVSVRAFPRTQLLAVRWPLRWNYQP